jgi:hypothetical protein
MMDFYLSSDGFIVNCQFRVIVGIQSYTNQVVTRCDTG